MIFVGIPSDKKTLRAKKTVVGGVSNCSKHQVQNTKKKRGGECYEVHELIGNGWVASSNLYFSLHGEG
jgi:hypothetical protein